MPEITKYSVVQCDLMAIQTAALHIIRTKSILDRESAFFRLYGDEIDSAIISVPDFIREFRAVLKNKGFVTTAVNEDPESVVIYYNDSQNQIVQDAVERNYLSIQQTSFMSPKQTAMMSRL